MIASTYKRKLQTDSYNLPYHYLDVMSQEYRLIWEIERVALLGYINKSLEPYKGQRILDAGCGDGRLCYELKDINAEVTGIDLSARAIAFAKMFSPNVKFHVVDLEDPSIDLGKFDQIVCQETLEHISPSRINLFLKSLDYLLKTGGTIIFTVPSKRLRVSMKHFQHFDQSSLVKTLETTFTVKEVLGYNSLSRKRNLFLIGKYISLILFPFRYKLKEIYKLYEYVAKFYEDSLLIDKPENGLGLIAICTKK